MTRAGGDICRTNLPGQKQRWTRVGAHIGWIEQMCGACRTVGSTKQCWPL